MSVESGRAPAHAGSTLGPWADISPETSRLTPAGTIEFVDHRAHPDDGVRREATSVGELVGWLRAGAIDGGLSVVQAATQGTAMAAIGAGLAPRTSIVAVVRGAVRALIGARPDLLLLASHLDDLLADDAAAVLIDPLASMLRDRADGFGEAIRAEHRRLASNGAGWIEATHGKRVRILLVGEAGPIATATIGTTSAIIRAAADQGARVEVLVPDGERHGRGAAILAGAVGASSIAIERISNGSVGDLLASRRVDLVLVHARSADREIGLTCEVGSLAAALLAHDAGVPYVGAASRSMMISSPRGPRAARASLADTGFVPLETVSPNLVTGVLTETGFVSMTALGRSA